MWLQQERSSTVGLRNFSRAEPKSRSNRTNESQSLAAK
jgi:hypothetical protein